MLLEMQMSLKMMFKLQNGREAQLNLLDMNASSDLDCRERTMLPKVMCFDQENRFSGYLS